MLEQMLFRRARCGFLVPAAFAATALALPAANVQAQWLLDVQAERLHDSNLTRAQKSSDILADGAWRLRGSAGRLFEVGERSEVVARAELAMTRYDTYTGVSSDSLGWNAAYRRKLGTGLTAPWVEAGLGASVENARESLRDLTRRRLYFTAGKRFSERWDGTLSFDYSSSRQRNNFPRVLFYSDKVFDVTGRLLSLTANYAPSEQWLIGVAADLRRGDVVSTTRRNPEIFRASNAIAADPAFGPDFIAYRLSGASTRSVTFIVSRALDLRSSLDASLAMDRTRTRAGLRYDGVRIGVSYIYRR